MIQIFLPPRKRLRHWALFRCLPLILLGCLAGCQSIQDPGTDALSASVIAAFSPSGSVDNHKLEPDLGYLRVTYQGALSLFVLAYLDHDPNGAVEVYYGPSGAVLRLQNGRLLSVSGTSVEWREVHLSANLRWTAALQQSEPIQRRRDVEPGERYGRTDALHDHLTGPGAKALAGVDPGTLTWFEEVTDDLPPGRVAINQSGSAVYGEQWLDAEHCLTWQIWPVGRGTST